MSALSLTIESFSPGQRVQTGFGTGIISAVSRIDSIIYVALFKQPSALYILRPEQVEPIENEH